MGGGGAHDKVVTSEATTGKSGHAKSPKVILSERDRGLHEPESPTLDSLGRTSPRPRRHLGRLSRFRTAHACDRQTEHATCVTTGRI